MAVKIGVNGFGRIGRLAVRAGINNPAFEFVAINDLTDSASSAHLFKYDSTFGTFDGEVRHTEKEITIKGKTIKVFNEKDPLNIPWGKMGVDIVLDCTGKFCDPVKAKAHLDSGAKKVIISAPAKNAGEGITFCMGINEGKYEAGKHHIISNASCTTNCLAPIVKVLHEKFGIVTGLMTTVHSYTNDQNTLDAPHKDLRRARAAAVSMIPTTTGAAKAIGLVMPELKGKLTGIAVRVPTPNVSLVDLSVVVSKKTTKDEINAAMKTASETNLKGYLRYCDEPLVSKDFNGDPHSSIFDSLCTDVADGGTHIKVLSWYDNEWGYTNRLLDLANYIAKKGI